MPRISQQTKDFLSVAATLGVGIASGLYMEARGKQADTFGSLACLVAFSALALLLALIPSQDMADLDEFRREQLSRLRLLNTMTEQSQKMAEEGKLQEALEWDEARAEIEARRKPK